MTVETGNTIVDLDPGAPVDTQPLGEANEHLQLLKRVLDFTFQGSIGDLYDDNSGSVLVGPVQTNRQPADIAALAAEMGLDLDDIGQPTRIDVLESNRVRNDLSVIILFDWAFTGQVEFVNATDFTGIVPQIDGVDIATIDIIDGLNYYDRSRIQYKLITSGPTYTTVNADRGKRLNYTGTGDLALEIQAGANWDTFLITNANATGDTTVVTVTQSLGELFQRGDGTVSPSFSITGRYKTVGLHRVNLIWIITGEYD